MEPKYAIGTSYNLASIGRGKIVGIYEDISAKGHFVYQLEDEYDCRYLSTESDLAQDIEDSSRMD